MEKQQARLCSLFICANLKQDKMQPLKGQEKKGGGAGGFESVSDLDKRVVQ